MCQKKKKQIENETLSIVFGAERFDKYFYGRRFIVTNNHKLLKSIFNRSIISCHPRFQKFFLHLQKYEFELQYSPSKYMWPIAVLKLEDPANQAKIC